jgi:hypothetical protein
MRTSIHTVLLIILTTLTALSQIRTIPPKTGVTGTTQTFEGVVRRVVTEATETAPSRETFVFSKRWRIRSDSDHRPGPGCSGQPARGA